MILFQEKENPDGRGSSSSPDMISFDLSDGNQYPPHLRMALDDDQYVEYQMEDMADFPSNAEEEERMLMKAVMESLKDLEVQSQQKKEPPETRIHGGSAFLNAVQCISSREESTSTRANQSETDSASSPVTRSQDQLPSSSESNPPSETSSSLARTVTSSVPGSLSQKESETGDVPGTKATVTVERSSSAPGKVLDGLIRRWDLNFFKNNK
jgi:hypothetical protein